MADGTHGHRGGCRAGLPPAGTPAEAVRKATGRVSVSSPTTITRKRLIRIVNQAGSVRGVAESSRLKYLIAARTTEAFAVGWFRHDGIDCLARQADHPNQSFQRAFDKRMWDETGRRGEMFVVEVRES